MVKQSQSPLRILKSINNPVDRRLFLSSLPDNLFVAEDLELSIDLWLNILEDKNYVSLFYRLRDKIKSGSDSVCFTAVVQNPVFTQRNNNGNIIFLGSLTLFMSPENRATYIDTILRELGPSMAEYISHTIFNESEGFTIIHEPNGRNECPDLAIIWPDGTVSYIEVKSILCSFFNDNKFKGNVNNAMKGVDLILNDMRLQKTKVNKCGTSLRNITIWFFCYFNNPDTGEIEYFKSFLVPAPLAIDCEFNKDGSFKKLGQKSDNNFNTVLNLKIRSPFNKYNTLADRAMLISEGYTFSGRLFLISNTEGNYLYKKELFDFYKLQIENNILINKDITLLSYNELKLNKYNTNPFATNDDKEYIKNVIKDFKIRINEQFGKGTVR